MDSNTWIKDWKRIKKYQHILYDQVKPAIDEYYTDLYNHQHAALE